MRFIFYQLNVLHITRSRTKVICLKKTGLVRTFCMNVLYVDFWTQHQLFFGVEFNNFIHCYATSESSFYSLKFVVNSRRGRRKRWNTKKRQKKRKVNTLLSVSSCIKNDCVHMCVGKIRTSCFTRTRTF